MCKISEMNLETAKYYGYEAQSNLDGILDVADTKLNDVASNLALAQEEIPLLGGVSIG